ncbi:MAG: ABC transporter substrate-binding protein, partial [Sarcina sp.]
MGKKIKFLCTMGLIATLVTGSLVGCGSKDSSGGGSTSSENEKVEITWWNFPNFEVVDGKVGKYEEQIVEAFEAKNPNIDVKVEMLSFNGGGEKINAAIASKSAPDILYDAPGRIMDYARQGVLVEVDDMIEKLNGDVSDELLAGCGINNKYY